MSHRLQLIAVRHGETVYNRDHRIQGQRDTELNEVGREQAQGLRERLAKLGYERVVCSDLSRCVETARLALGEVEMELSRAFRERGFGVLEGLTWSEARARYPEVAARPTAVSDLRPELGVEDMAAAFRPRVLRGVHRLWRRHQTVERLLLFTHGGVMRVLLEKAAGAKTFMLPNCAVYHFSYDGERLSLERPAS